MTNVTLDDRATPLPPGTAAPDFQLQSTPGQTVSLAELRGQPIILAFYPEDWSPVCSDQMVLYQELLPEFQKFNAVLMGISVDGVWCHLGLEIGEQGGNAGSDPSRRPRRDRPEQPHP